MARSERSGESLRASDCVKVPTRRVPSVCGHHGLVPRQTATLAVEVRSCPAKKTATKAFLPPSSSPTRGPLHARWAARTSLGTAHVQDDAGIIDGPRDREITTRAVGTRRLGFVFALGRKRAALSISGTVSEGHADHLRWRSPTTPRVILTLLTFSRVVHGWHQQRLQSGSIEPGAADTGRDI